MDFDNSTETISPDIGSAISIGGDLKVAGRIIRATSTGLVPTGSTQGTAAAITNELSIISTSIASANLGVILPATTVVGMTYTIVNPSAYAVIVYPGVSGVIDAGAVNAGITVPAGAAVTVHAVTTTSSWSTSEKTIVAGTNVTVTYGAGTITIASTGGGGGASTGAAYLTLATDASLTNERVLVPSAEFTVTDGGAGGNYGLKINAIPGNKIQGRTVYGKDTVSCGIIIPFYQYPANVLTNANVNLIIDLKKKYQDVPVTVIFNPSSGPGTVTDANYTVLVKRLLGAGISVLAYVDTNYTARPLVTVQADINTYLSLYSFASINNGQYGIFFDRMSTATDATTLAYYANLTAYAHNLGMYPVMGNPGTTVTIATFNNGSCDEYVVFENNTTWPTEAYLKGDTSDGYMDFDYAERAAMIVGVAFDAEKIQMMAKYCSNIYVSDAPAANAYSVLPSYLENLFVLLSNKTVHKNLGLVYAAQLNMIMP